MVQPGQVVTTTVEVIVSVPVGSEHDSNVSTVVYEVAAIVLIGSAILRDWGEQTARAST
jgi:hypothetical protein